MIIQRQAKVITAGNPASDQLLLVLHGYGQLADYFIRKFEAFANDYFIVAPEGPHRFYLKGFDGRVGASWMTKEKREWDIADNMQYLQQVVEQYGKGKSITLLGFSQGGATAARFAGSTDVKIHRFISWASAFPDDQISTFKDKLSTTALHFAVGNNDPFFTENAVDQALSFYKDLNFSCHTFEGVHDIDFKTLFDILNMPTFGTLSANTSENNN